MIKFADGVKACSSVFFSDFCSFSLSESKAFSLLISLVVAGTRLELAGGDGTRPGIQSDAVAWEQVFGLSTSWTGREISRRVTSLGQEVATTRKEGIEKRKKQNDPSRGKDERREDD
jgi:hypothetical protein